MKNTKLLSSKRLVRISLVLSALGALCISNDVSAAPDTPAKPAAKPSANAANGDAKPSANAANGNAPASTGKASAKPKAKRSKSKKARKAKVTAKANGDATAGEKTESPATDAPKITPRLALPANAVQAQPKDCNLLVKEAPRGGQLEVQGQKFGASPVVRVGNQVTRILRREQDKISVQIPRNSNGGPVTVLVAGKKQECGSLTIIGLDVD
jgi:hypothetical protein